MPELVRLYIRQCLIGFALARIFVAQAVHLGMKMEYPKATVGKNQIC